MSPAREPVRHRDWYKVSVDTLRGWGIFVLMLAVAGAGYLAFRGWERYAIQREAARAIDDARVLFQRLRSERSLANFKTEYEGAWDGIEQARALYAKARYDDALARAERSREMLLSLLDASRNNREAGEAQFIAVQGRVEYRRADRGEWEQARGRVMLRPGDYVKTGNSGSAEIMFGDGTLYTVRADTLFLVSARSAGQQGKKVQLQYGWIDLNTAQSGSRVATPAAEAVVAEQSEAVVSYDQGKRQGRFSSYRGRMEVKSGGETRQVAALQSVRQEAGKLSPVEGLPDAPRLTRPEENADFDSDTQKQLRLVWEGVQGGERYALQISRNRLFVDNVIDVADRRSTAATLGIQGEGTFLWRVAAMAGGGVQGPWSAPGRFRIVSGRSGKGSGDKEPPELQVQSVQSYGSIFIVGGHTEPGATVTVNDDPVTVQADGAFTKTIQLAASGWAVLEIRAVDAAGNQATHQARVFVESL
ncbi:MAG TPA: FecR domain-containing protein [Thermoanaerobaculia bacterium]|nr:FecR domain-containing protein [Thermoanaerobaculia bacterium]